MDEKLIIAIWVCSELYSPKYIGIEPPKIHEICTALNISHLVSGSPAWTAYAKNRDKRVLEHMPDMDECKCSITIGQRVCVSQVSPVMVSDVKGFKTAFENQEFLFFWFR